MGRAPAVPTRFCRSDMPAAIQTPGLPAPASHLKPMGAPRQQRNASRRLPLHQGRPGGLAGHAAAKGGFQNMVLPWEQRGMNSWCLPRPVEHSATLRYSRMLDKDFPPPSATASHTSGSPIVGQSHRKQSQYSNRGTRYRGFPGHEPHKPDFSLPSPNPAPWAARNIGLCMLTAAGLRRGRCVRRTRRRVLGLLSWDASCRWGAGQIGDVLVARTKLFNRAGQRVEIGGW